MSVIKIRGSTLYQWDTDRQVEITPWQNLTVDEVHFMSPNSDTAYVVKPTTKDETVIANIPNVLLQTTVNIRVFAVMHTDNGERTVSECTFGIIPRQKPSDYVYTETECKTYEALEERIKALEENGENYILTDADKKEIASLIDCGETIPDYVIDEVERFANVVKSHQHANTFSILAVSDTHIGLTDPYDSMMHLKQAMKLIAEKPNLIDLAIHCGDHIAGSDETNENGLEEYDIVNSILSEAFNGLSVMRTYGNHDPLCKGANGNLSSKQLYFAISKYNRNVVRPDTEKDRGYCYLDLDEFKTRIICMNSTDIKDYELSDSFNSNDIHYISATQLQWLSEVLTDVGKKENWKTLIVCHHPLDYYGEGKTRNAIPIIDAFINKSSGSITQDGVTVNFDYTHNISNEFIVQIHGHTHSYLMGYFIDPINGEFTGESYTENRIHRLCVPNASFTRNNEYGTSTDVNTRKWGTLETHHKVQGTAEDTAFCVLTFDLDNKKIYADHYGAGIDRVLPFSNYDIPVEGILLDKSSGVLEVGNTLTLKTTLRPCDGKLNSFATNQNVIWTSSNDNIATVDNGVVTAIDGGNVVIIATSEDGGYIAECSITVTGTKTPTGYTDIINIENEDYFMGKRVSSGSGALSSTTDPNYVATKIIDISGYEKPVVIRTKGVVFNNNLHTNTTYACYDADGNFLIGAYIVDGAGNSDNGTSISLDEENNATITISVGNPESPNYKGNIKGIRISGYCETGSGADLIVTINEEIK